MQQLTRVESVGEAFHDNNAHGATADYGLLQFVQVVVAIGKNRSRTSGLNKTEHPHLLFVICRPHKWEENHDLCCVFFQILPKPHFYLLHLVNR